MKRLVFLGYAAVVFAAAVFATYMSLDIKLFYIPGIYWNMPIPIIYWGLAFLYSYIYSRLFKERLSVFFARIVKPWLLAEIAVLLIDLKIRLLASNPLNRVYTAYIWLVMLFIFCLTGYLAASFIRNLIDKKDIIQNQGLVYIFAFMALVFLLIKNALYLDLSAMVVAGVIFCFINPSKFLQKSADLFKYLISDNARFMVLLYCLALAVRVAFSVIMIGQVGDKFPSGSCDGDGYDYNAVRIAKDFSCLFNGSLGFSIFGPYYWIFLALLYKFFGRSFYITSFAQSVLASFLAPIIYRITVRLTRDERISKMAGILTALCMSLIYLSVVLQPESLMIVLLYLFILLIAKYGEKRRGYAALGALSGLIFGLMNGTRSIMILFPIFLIVWLLFFVRNIDLKTKVTSLAVFLIVSYIVTYPAEFMYSKYKQKNELKRNEKTALVISQGAMSYAAWNPELDAMGFNPFSGIRRSVDTFTKHPKKVAWLFLSHAAIQAHRFIFINFFGYFNPFFLILPSKYNNYFGAYMLGYAYILIALGAVRLFSRRYSKDTVYLLLFLFAYYFISHPLFFNIHNARHRSPMHPLFIMLFSLGFFRIWDWMKGKIRAR
jgi:hypothetical protein